LVRFSQSFINIRQLEKIKIYRVLIKTLEERRIRGRSRSRSEDNIKMNRRTPDGLIWFWTKINSGLVYI
jgi:hypothetical protein